METSARIFCNKNTDLKVCPASWRPGDETIKPDVTRALKYFEKSVDDEDLDYLEAGFSKLQSSNSKSKLKKFLTKEIFHSLRTKKTPTFGSSLKVRHCEKQDVAVMVMVARM